MQAAFPVHFHDILALLTVDMHLTLAAVHCRVQLGALGGSATLVDAHDNSNTVSHCLST